MGMSAALLKRGDCVSNLEKVCEKFDRQIWRTIGARFNASRRLQRKQNASVFSISILSVYLMIEAVIPPSFIKNIDPVSINSVVILASVFILILSLLEARKSYELKAERLHNSAIALNKVYGMWQLDKANEVGARKCIEEYHVLISTCSENHEPIDDAVFRAAHRVDFNMCWLECKWIEIQNFIVTYWLYITLVLFPPLMVMLFL